MIGFFKTPVLPKRGPWKNLEQVEFATLEWVYWFSNRQLLEPIGNMPPAEFEATQLVAPATVAALPRTVAGRIGRQP